MCREGESRPAKKPGSAGAARICICSLPAAKLTPHTLSSGSEVTPAPHLPRRHTEPQQRLLKEGWKEGRRQRSLSGRPTEAPAHRGLGQAAHGHSQPQQHVVAVGRQPQELGHAREGLRRCAPVHRGHSRPARQKHELEGPPHWEQSCPTGNSAPVPGEKPLQLLPVGHVGDGGAVPVEQRQEHTGCVRPEPVDLLTRLLG